MKATDMKSTELGLNKTGLQMSPEHMKKMMEVTELTEPTSEGSDQALAEIRLQYIGAADPLGSVPPPLTMKGMAKTGMKMVTGNRPQVFIDKLGERLAFERNGVRLYDALITKFMGTKDVPGSVTLDHLNHHRVEEAEHMALVKECIEQLGGDPTVQTPCADVAGVEGSGLMQVITDPKTTFMQSLHAILVAELADNAAWEELIELARQMGHEDMVARFEEASQHEQEHLEHVKQWHLEGTLADAKMVKH
jgi:ferritin-like metal-binding protein YciE